jgi:hypothetical protein
LGHFGSPLGVIFIDFSLVFIRFREQSRFLKKKMFESRLGSILGRFGVDLGAQKGANMAPKTEQKTNKNILIFYHDFWSILIELCDFGRPENRAKPHDASAPRPGAISTSYYYPKGAECNFKSTKVAFRHLSRGKRKAPNEFDKANPWPTAANELDKTSPWPTATKQFNKASPKTAHDHPKTAHERPKSDPRPPKSDPRPPKSDPRPPQDRPRATQDRPRATQDRPRATQERPRATQDRPRATQDRPKTAQERPKTAPRRPKNDQDRPKNEHIDFHWFFIGFSIILNENEAQARPETWAAEKRKAPFEFADESPWTIAANEFDKASPWPIAAIKFQPHAPQATQTARTARNKPSRARNRSSRK